MECVQNLISPVSLLFAIRRSARTTFSRGLQGGYKDGLQPESLADGKLAGETKSTSVEN